MNMLIIQMILVILTSACAEIQQKPAAHYQSVWQLPIGGQPPFSRWSN